MSIKFVAMDVDGTLAKTDETIPPHVGVKLRSLESKGVKLLLVSGRTAPYLAGLARGLGLRKPLVAGENGGVIFDPLTLWEKKLDVIPEKVVTQIKTDILKDFNEVWFQPNQTMLTVFTKDLARIEELYYCVLKLKQISDYGLKLNKYCDAVEIMPKENSKGKALAVIKETLKVRREEMIAVGNTVVDLPMHREVDEMLLIGRDAFAEGVKNYSSIEDALKYLEERIFRS